MLTAPPASPFEDGTVSRAPLTSVIIPCWNALELTRVCLQRLVLRTTRAYELIVIDNGSNDGTGDWLEAFRRRALRENPHGTLRRFRIISNAKNLGYPASMNQGIRSARGGFLLFGNNDVAVTPLWLENMQAALRPPRPPVGGVSPLSNPVRALEAPMSWGCRPLYRGIKSLERYAGAALLRRGRPVFIPVEEFLNGFWFLTRRSVIRKIGSFDERYGPGGFEDFDLQWRMRRAGYRLGFAGRSYVHHIGFGCSEVNGLKPREVYGAARRAALLHDKFPETAAMPYSASPKIG
ncbi:MAG: glycosyltransferase family 2 protein [Elusimicrobiota bacterium]